MGKDYCMLLLQIGLFKEAFCSENIVCSKQTNLVPPTVIQKDRFGNPIDPVAHKLNIDPAKFIDLSQKTIMPVFNENSFIFLLDSSLFMESQILVKFEVFLNKSIFCHYTMNIAQYITQCLNQ